MSSVQFPFNLTLESEAFQSLHGVNTIIRRLSDMIPCFADQQAVKQILAEDDPILYEFWEIEQEGSAGELSFGLTRIHAGKIGKEYHMTKGHFHVTDGDEIYVVVSGHGLLLLQTREGETRSLEMVPGGICYVPGGWAHRTVNTGNDNLLFLSIWPPNIEHDYETVAKHGFPIRVMEGADGPIVTDNDQS